MVRLLAWAYQSEGYASHVLHMMAEVLTMHKPTNRSGSLLKLLH